ncbi:MAG TPA: efflux RND transporter periplasmic adaptor subunit [Gemmatimonadaceae bacterium]|nr:efflux RND transporter periplasmic adaptor subunit [Gemmatimonadaceae bacterium]
MRSRSTAVAASTNPITTAVHSALLALALVGVAAAASACAPAAAKTTNAADSAIPVVAQPISLSARGWSATASGIVQANASVDVAFQVPGKVVTIGPDEGQSVRAGQPIASLDPTEYRLAVEQAGAQSDRAAHDRDRNQPLLASGGIAPAEMEHLEIGARQSAAAADLAKKHLADTKLEAPIPGIVSRRVVEVGATVAAGQTVYTIVALDPVRVRVGVPEADVGHITEGATATVRIPALDTSFAGRVSLIGVAADPATRSYAVEISVPNPARKLRAGMVAEATIHTRESTSAMMVPAPAVVHDGGVNGTTIVYVLDHDAARVHARRVTTGAAHGDSLEITSGVATGEQIVVAGQQRLRDGARVQQVASPSSANAAKGAR